MVAGSRTVVVQAEARKNRASLRLDGTRASSSATAKSLPPGAFRKSLYGDYDVWDKAAVAKVTEIS